jgi:hypothetical protein
MARPSAALAAGLLAALALAGVAVAGTVLVREPALPSGRPPEMAMSEDTSPPAAGRTVLRVAPSGDDRGDGSEARPLRTVGAAVKRARPGTTVSIAAGTYAERVDIRSVGTSDSPVVYAAEKAGEVVFARGFRLSGDHNVVRDITVTPGEARPSAMGTDVAQVTVTGDDNLIERLSMHDDGNMAAGDAALAFTAGSRNVARDVDLHDCAALVFAGPGRDNRVSGGTVHHTRDLLVGIEQAGTVVEGLDLHDPGQHGTGGNSADGINLNARDVTIRANRIHRVFTQHAYQHTDAIQWWNTADGLVIERNIIGSAERGGGQGRRDQGHLMWSSAVPGQTSRRVIIRGNIFLGTDNAYVMNSAPQVVRRGQADDWQWLGNSFLGNGTIRADVLQQVHGWVFADNLFAVLPDFSAAPPESYRRHHNAWLSDPYGAARQEEAGSFAVGDPQWADPAWGAAGGVEADWRPRRSSPLVGQGAPLPALGRDQRGRKRPSPPTIGALEP